MIEFSFYGTSHGKEYGGTISGLPDGFTVDVAAADEQLRRRKQGYGRSTRQFLPDSVCFTGPAKNTAAGGVLTFTVPNARHPQPIPITAVRSGHADITGAVRYKLSPRDVAEFASARGTVCYVVLGAVCKQLIARSGIETYSYTENIGGISSAVPFVSGQSEKEKTFAPLNCPDFAAGRLMAELIDRARETGDSLGGIAAVGASGVPMGLGEATPYFERLDGVISAAMMSIPSVKGIEFGAGQAFASMTGRESHDAVAAKNGGIVYEGNNCGGIVGGITTGKDIFFRLTVKPVPTVKGVKTIDSVTLKETAQHYERADVCVVPNVGVIAENILAYVLANEIIREGKEELFRL